MSGQFFYRTPVSTALLAILLLLLVLGGGLSCDSADDPVTPREIAAGPSGGGGMESFGEGGEGVGTELAHPTVIQSMFDYTQTGIEPWEPVVDTQQYIIGGQTYTANKLATSDPFIGTWQLENGDIVITNEPLTTFLASGQSSTLPATETWAGPDGNELVASNEIIVQFDPLATQEDIEAVISDYHLSVIFSSFDPPTELGLGNDCALFHFRYLTSDYANYAAASTAFAVVPHVVARFPNFVSKLKPDYLEGVPQDDYYDGDEPGGPFGVRQIDFYGLQNSSLVSMGPPDGQPLSQVATAVIDDGVFRGHADFQIPSSSNKKVSWVGMDCYNTGLVYGLLRGTPNLTSLVHGTRISGTLSSTTRTLEASPGSVGLSPQNGVFPVRLLWNQEEGGYTIASLFQAMTAIKNLVGQSTWYEDVRVVNMSMSAEGKNFEQFGGVSALNLLFSSDRKKGHDRIYVASAGNYDSRTNSSQDRLSYPAACPTVIGVAGFWTNIAGTEFRPNLTLQPANYTIGSFYRNDAANPPYTRAYDMSAIYGFGIYGGGPGGPNWNQVVPNCFVPAAYTGTLCQNFVGTSFAAPQVSGLAIELYRRRPTRSYSAVTNHIYNNTVELPVNCYPLPPRIRYIETLQSW